jgi:hypothetical protein
MAAFVNSLNGIAASILNHHVRNGQLCILGWQGKPKNSLQLTVTNSPHLINKIEY